MPEPTHPDPRSARFEFRIGWEASSVQGFQGTSEWMVWDGPEQTIAEVQAALNAGGRPAPGLEVAIDGSGFGWWSEVRDAA